MPVVVTRQQWGARPPSEPYIKLKLPTPVVYIHHTGGEGDGATYVRLVQNNHMDVRDWRDIGYNFLVDDDGNIYVGRGYGNQGGANLGADNSFSHSICAMGNFDTRRVPAALEDSIIWLLEQGAALGYWETDDIRGHRDELDAATECPGDFLYARLPAIRLKVNTPIPTPLPPITPRGEVEHMLFQNDKAQGGNGAVIHVFGSVSVLVDNMDDLRDYLAQGIPLIKVRPSQFERYENLRVDKAPTA